MKKDNSDTAVHFDIVESEGDEVIIEITEEDYQKQTAAGVPEDEILPAGFHKARRGGFRQRHPNFNLENTKINIINSEQDARLAAVKDKEKKAA